MSSQQHHPERDQGKNAEPLSEEDQQQQEQQHTNRRPSRRDEKQYQDVAAAGEQLPENKRKREEGKAPSSTAASLPEENNNDKHRRRPSSAESSKSLVRRQSLRSVPKPEDVTEEEQGPSSSTTNNKNKNIKNKKKSTSPIRTNSPEDRTYVVKQDDLPPDQQYWASSNCNPFKSESGEKEKERQQKQHQNSEMTGAIQQRNNNTSSSLVPYQEQQQPEKVNPLADPNKKMTVFEFSMPPQSKEQAQQQLKRSMPGAVVVSSSHHPLQNKRSVVALSPFAAKNPKKVQKYRKNPNSPGAYRSDNEQHRHSQHDNDHDDQVDEQQQQQQQVDDELGNFVKIPPIKTTKGGIASKMRNANVLRQMKPEVLHVGQDYYYNSDENEEEEQQETNRKNKTNKKNQVGVHQPDTLERKAIDLLVVHDHTNKGRGGGSNSTVAAENHFQRDQKIAIISPPKEPQSQQQQAFGSSSLNNNSSTSHSRRLLALERSREQQIKEKFNASRRQNEAMPGYLLLSQGNGRTASSIPPLIRTVAEEARNAEIVVYEKYDREFATRKLEAIAMKKNYKNGGNNNSKTDSPLRHPETSRVYPMKVKPPEGFSSTEDAIVNLAKQHEAKRFYGMINTNDNHQQEHNDVDGIKNNRRDHNNNNRHPFFIDNELNPQVRNNHYNLNHKVLMTSTNTNVNNRGGGEGGNSPSSQSQSQSYTSPTSNTARFASTTISNQNLHNPAHALTSTNNIQSKHSDSTFNSVVQLNSNNNNGAELGSSSAAAFASSKNNKKGHFATVPSSELRSMDSLMGIAVSHKKLSEAVRGLERCSNAANQYYYSSSATSSGRCNFTSPLHRDQNTIVSSSSSARNANVVPPKPVFPRSYVRQQQTIMNINNNSLSQHTHSVYPNMKEQDVSSWLQSKYNNSNHTNSSSSSSPPGTLLLQERQQQQQQQAGTNTNTNNDDDENAEVNNGALIIAYQKDAKKETNRENNEHHQLVTIPSSYPGGSDRVVKISGRGGRSSGAVGGDFSLLSSSSAASQPDTTTLDLSGEDVNSLPSALPSISQGTPMKFSELMQKRLKEAERTAIPLN